MARVDKAGNHPTKGASCSFPALIMAAALTRASMTTALLLALAGSLILMTLIVQRLNKASS